MEFPFSLSLFYPFIIPYAGGEMRVRKIQEKGDSAGEWSEKLLDWIFISF